MNRVEESRSLVYAIKQPRSDLSPKQRIHAVACLRNEINVLLDLKDHPHIIKLMYVLQVHLCKYLTRTNIFSDQAYNALTHRCLFTTYCTFLLLVIGSKLSADDGNFELYEDEQLVLERLHGTLRDKITWWNDRSINDSTSTCSAAHMFRCWKGTGGHESLSLRLSNHSAGMLWKTQMKILSDIAGAMAFLHSQNIVLRDLKTENCGFDSSGSIKLFDFGLAARLPAACRDDGISNSDSNSDTSSHRHHNIMKVQGTSDQYKFSIEGGTLRYMSPEAVLGKPYGKATDAYAFSLLIWETMSLCIPFECMATDEFMNQIIRRHRRPPLYPQWPQELRHLLTKSWATDPLYRPSFLQMESQLNDLLNDTYGSSTSKNNRRGFMGSSVSYLRTAKTHTNKRCLPWLSR